MTDITPEQRKAVQWAQRKLAQSLDTADAPHLRVLLSIIPEDLKKPPVELPTEKWTAWLDKDGDVWVVDSEGKMQCLKYEDSKPEMYAPFRAMAQEVDVEKDERVIAWNTIAKHPLFAEDYGSEDTLINAMMNHLNRIFHATPQQPTDATAIADEVKVGDKLAGKRVVAVQPVGSQIVFDFDNGSSWTVGQNRLIENWERGA